jgi:hypothetical protein
MAAVSTTVDMAPWWTEADSAEEAVLLAELVLQVPLHKARCAACARERAEGWPCPAVTEAIEAVLDWRWRRGLLSRADWHRRRHLRERLAEVQGEAA